MHAAYSEVECYIIMPKPMSKLIRIVIQLPEDLKDHSEVTTRDQQDAQLHQDRMATIARASSGNREQRRWLERREAGKGKRGEGAAGAGAGGDAELSAKLAELGVTGFQQGGAAAVAAIHGSLEDMLKAAREALAPKKDDDKERRPAGDAEGRTESQNDADNEAENETENGAESAAAHEYAGGAEDSASADVEGG